MEQVFDPPGSGRGPVGADLRGQFVTVHKAHAVRRGCLERGGRETRRTSLVSSAAAVGGDPSDQRPPPSSRRRVVPTASRHAHLLEQEHVEIAVPRGNVLLWYFSILFSLVVWK